MKKIFVSGCYDIIHAGHIQFFHEAKALGDHLTVCFASDQILLQHKGRRSSLPQEHKRALLANLRDVDDVVMGENPEMGLDFQDHFRRIKPDVLAVTEDDQYTGIKKKLCDEMGAAYVKLDKTPPRFPPVSTTGIVRWIKAPDEAPLRVDFAGGWLDVPRFAREEGFVVNCAISPLVSLQQWPYEHQSGLGGSGAWALLNGESGVDSELAMGAGWQDPAVIRETGLCVWQSGPKPQLYLKRDGAMLQGRMALCFTGMPHDTPALADRKRDYGKIVQSSVLAAEGVEQQDLEKLGEGIRAYHAAQREEGMPALPEPGGIIAHKYCGSGWGGYALYLFRESSARDAYVRETSAAMAVEPYLRSVV